MLFSLKSRLLATITLLVIIPFATMVIIIAEGANEVIGQSVEDSTVQIMDQHAAFVNTLTTQIEDVANQVLSNSLTQEWINSRLDRTVTDERKFVLNAELRTYLSSISLNHSSVSSIAVFDDNGLGVGIRDQIFQDSSFLQSEWYRAFQGEGRRWVPAHYDPYQPSYLKDQSMNSLLFPLVQLKTFTPIGVLKVNFLSSLLQEPLDKIRFGRTGRVYLVDRNSLDVLGQNASQDDIVRQGAVRAWADSSSKGKFKLKADGTSYVLFSRKLHVENWILIGKVPENELFSKIASIRTTMLAIGGLLALVTIGAAFWLSLAISRPLSSLARAMRHVERGDFDEAAKHIPNPVKLRKSEVGIMAMVTYNTIKRLRYLIETEYRTNLRRRDAEYKALLMQINPHFLYNTLEVIGSLAVQKRSDDVVDVTEALGKMMRFSLKLNADSVKLSEELTYIRDYVAIMKIRFGDRIDVAFDVAPDAGEVPILKFILQPLVENAVKYSLDQEAVAIVALTAKRDGGRLAIEIRDNGAGMPEVLIRELQGELKRDEWGDVLHTEGKSIGLRNVLARCRLYYGEAFEAVIRSEPGNGTAITLLMPVQAS